MPTSYPAPIPQLFVYRSEDRIMLESYKACGKTWGSETVAHAIHAMGLLDGHATPRLAGKTAADVEARCAYFKALIAKKKKRKGAR